MEEAIVVFTQASTFWMAMKCIATAALITKVKIAQHQQFIILVQIDFYYLKAIAVVIEYIQ